MLYDCNGDQVKVRRKFPLGIILVLVTWLGIGGVSLWRVEHKKAEISHLTIDSGTTSTITWDVSPTSAQTKVILGFYAPEVNPPKDHPPLHINVGPYIYTVHYTNSRYLQAGNSDGFTNLFSHEIWLNSSEGGQGIRHVVLHELMHTAMNAQGFVPRTREGPDDDFIEATSPVLLEILRDNPLLVRWLCQPTQTSVVDYPRVK